MLPTSILLFLVVCASVQVQAWDSAEMQMFDLVEDLKISFYDYLGIPFNASSAEVRRAYRRLSLEMHPDKRKDDPEADKKFQKLVAVYEILRGDEMKRKYNEVLQNGLPDWRTPVFYFRKLHKMTMWEFVGLLVTLVTTFHFAILWGVYLEKKLNEEDRLNIALRRRKAMEQRKTKGGPSVVEAEIAKELDAIPKPRWIDILPIAIVRGFYWVVVNSPQICKGTFNFATDSLLAKRRQKMEKLREAEEKKKEMEERTEKRRQEKEKKKQQAKHQYEEQLQFICREASTLLSQVDEKELSTAEKSSLTPAPITDTSSAPAAPTKSSEWEPEELVELIHAVAKYPGGTTDRWEKIAKYVERPVAQVIKMVKQIQEQQRLGPSQAQNDSSSLVNILQDSGKLRVRRGRRVDIWETQQKQVLAQMEEDENQEVDNNVVNPLLAGDSDDEEEQLSSAKRKQRKRAARKTAKSPDATDNHFNEEEVAPAEEDVTEDATTSDRKERKKPRTKEKYTNPESAARPWSQEEQTQLETALRTHPKGTPDRWDVVAAMVPSRSRDECISRVKHLAEKMHAKA